MQYWFGVLLAIGCIAKVNTLMCYYCKVSLDAGCYDPFNKSSMTDANEVDFGSEYVCAKSKIIQDGVTSIVRAPLKSSACANGVNSCTEASQDNIKTTLCCCSSDFCNNALTLHKQSRAVYFTLEVLIIMILFRFF